MLHNIQKSRKSRWNTNGLSASSALVWEQNVKTTGDTTKESQKGKYTPHFRLDSI